MERPEMSLNELTTLFDKFDYSELFLMDEMFREVAINEDQQLLMNCHLVMMILKKIEEPKDQRNKKYSLMDTFDSIEKKCSELSDKELKFLGSIAETASIHQDQNEFDYNDEEDYLPYGYYYGEEGIELIEPINTIYEIDSILSKICEERDIPDENFPTKSTIKKGKTKKLTNNKGKDKDKDKDEDK